MYTFIVIIHLFVSIILMAVVLLQAGKGAEMGAAFGGSSQTIFGSRGAATFLSKLTVGAAVLFMVTSLSLSILSRERSFASSVIPEEEKKAVVPKETPVPGGPVTLPESGAKSTPPEATKPMESAPAAPPAK